MDDTRSDVAMEARGASHPVREYAGKTLKIMTPWEQMVCRRSYDHLSSTVEELVLTVDRRLRVRTILDYQYSVLVITEYA